MQIDHTRRQEQIESLHSYPVSRKTSQKLNFYQVFSVVVKKEQIPVY